MPAELRFGVRERVSAEGEILVSPSERDLAELREKIRSSGAESIAISLLFSFANSENERAVAAALREADVRPCGSDIPVRPERVAPTSSVSPVVHVIGTDLSDKNVRPTQAHPDSPALPISVSHEILPEFREYERAAI